MSRVLHPLEHLPPYHPETEILNAIIDTPCGSRNKYKFDERTGVLCNVLLSAL